MEKATFILQTTRAGRLPTNASFTEEGVARAETERAQKSGLFEHIKLVSMAGADRRVLFEAGKPPGSAQSATPGKPGAARPKKKQVTPAQLISRASTLITLLLIFGVIAYAVEYFMTK